MFIRALVFLLCIGVLNSSLVANQDLIELQREMELAARVSNEEVQTKAIKLLIFASVLSSQTGEIVEVSPKMREKYNLLRNGVYATLPVALGVRASAKAVSARFPEMVAAVTALVNWSGGQIVKSATTGWDALLKLGTNRSIRIVSWPVRSSFKLVQPVLKILISKKFAISLAALSGSASLAASSFIMGSTPERALTVPQIRGLLGHHKELAEVLDQKIDELQIIYDISEDKRELIRASMVEEIVKQAVDHQFSDEAVYTVDVLSILAQHNAIDKEQAMATLTMLDAFEVGVKPTQRPQDFELLKTNLDVLIATSAVLEQLLIDGGLNREVEKEVRQMLVETNATISRVEDNFN